MIGLWKAMPGEQTPRHPSSYLYRAAVRETVRAVKRRREAMEVEPDENRPDPLPTPDRVLESKELGDAIQEVLDALSPDGRYLFFASGRTLTENRPPMDYRELVASLSGPFNGSDNVWWVDARVIEALRGE